MNLYHSTTKGIRECREARRQRVLRQQHHGELVAHKQKPRKPSLISRILHWHP